MQDDIIAKLQTLKITECTAYRTERSVSIGTLQTLYYLAFQSFDIYIFIATHLTILNAFILVM